MIKVRLFSDFYDSPTLLFHLKNQTPSLTGTMYKNIEFVCDDSYTHSVTFNQPGADLKSPKENNIGFLMDIPQIYSPTPDSLKNIGKYFCWYKEHKDNIKDIFVEAPFSFMFYHTPILEANDFKMKRKRMSIVVSGKRFMPDQNIRLQVVDKLLQTNLDIHFYGRDFATSSDARIKGPIPFMEKQKALAEYQYSICMENMVYDGWLTEKFYDCVINNCVPITNSPTALKEINNKAFCYLDFSKPAQNIVEVINEIYHNDDFLSRNSALLEAKESVINGKFSICEKIHQTFN
jgi:hypothetical protein